MEEIKMLEIKMNEMRDLFDDRNWQDVEGYAEGTKEKVLRDDEFAKTILLKLPKGFHVDRHSHATCEQFLVLKGEYISKDKKYPAGSYEMFKAHEKHGPFESKDDTLILFIWDPKS